MNLNNEATLRAIDRLAKTVTWYSEQRSRVFTTLCVLSMAAITFYFGVGATTTNKAIENVRLFIPIFMGLGGTVAVFTDWWMFAQQKAATFKGRKSEGESGSAVDSFVYLDNFFLYEMRFMICYIVMIIFSVGLVGWTLRLIPGS